MTRSRVMILLLAIAAVPGTVVWRLHSGSPPSCTSEPALDGAYAALRDRYQLTSIFLNDIRTAKGGWFSSRYECTAEITSIRGNQDLADMPWRRVHYSVMHVDGDPDFAVLVEVGGATPFVRQKPSFWQRLIGGR